MRAATTMVSSAAMLQNCGPKQLFLSCVRGGKENNEEEEEEVEEEEGEEEK